MKLTFYGATDTVTGSRFLLESDTTRVLVDCGLFQGIKALRLRNWDPFPVDPSSLDAIVLTHAHIDHSGYIPALTSTGRFRGKVLCTEATRDLCRILLPDSGYLQEEQAEFLNRIHATKHDPAKPLYTAEDGERALEYFQTVETEKSFALGDLQLTYRYVGHILGASCVHITDGRSSISFSGDVGRPEDPMLKPPRPMIDADVMVVESTYGNRRHPEVDAKAALAEIANKTFERGGVLLIPAFAVGRSQLVLHYITELMGEGTIPRVPVYLDSPMAIKATELFLNHQDINALTREQCKAIADLVQTTPTPDESRAITFKEGPMIVISASGMATGGRVLHHLAARLGDRKNTVLFVGFQAAGTRGEALLSGTHEIKIHGAYYPVQAEIRRIDALSAHADACELVDWLRPNKPPRDCYLVHGEPGARDAMRRALRDHLGWNTHTPSLGDTVEF